MFRESSSPKSGVRFRGTVPSTTLTSPLHPSEWRGRRLEQRKVSYDM